MITNNGDGALSKFVVDIKEEAQTATTNQSNSETVPVHSILGHSQFTYQVGDPNVTTSGITLPNPPPSSIHVTVTHAEWRYPGTLGWAGQLFQLKGRHRVLS